MALSSPNPLPSSSTSAANIASSLTALLLLLLFAALPGGGGEGTDAARGGDGDGALGVKAAGGMAEEGRMEGKLGVGGLSTDWLEGAFSL